MSGMITQAQIDDLEAGINTAFAAVEQALANKVYAESLPLVGDELKTAFDNAQAALTHIKAIKETVFNTLGTLTGATEYAEGAVESAINQALANSGYGDLGTIVDAVVNGGEVTFTFASNDTYTYNQALASDLGLGPLGITTAGTASASLAYDFDLTVGVDSSGFFVNTGATNEFALNLSLTAPGFTADASLGFVNFAATDEGSSLTANFVVDLFDGDGKLRISELGNNFISATVGGNADINLHLAADMGSAAFPSVSADFNVDWAFAAGTVVNPTDNNAGFGSTPTVAFNNVQLDLGSFVDDFVAPVFDRLSTILEPLNTALAVLNSDIKFLKIIPGWQTLFDRTGNVEGGEDVPDGKITLLDLLKMADPDTNLAGLIDAMKMVDQIIDWAEFFTQNDFGPEGYDLGSFAINEDIRNAALVIENVVPYVTATAANLAAALNGLDGPGFADVDPGSGLSGQAILQTIIGSPQFSLPILENPASLFGLFLGKDVDLVEVQLPHVELGFPEVELASVPVFWGVFFNLTGSLDLAVDLAMGFDTRGLRQFATTGFADYAAILNGFYLNDFDLAGNERPEITFSATLDAVLSLDAVVAEIAGGGSITGEIMFDLADSLWTPGTPDGRIYLDTMIAAIQNNPFELFDTSGRITAGLSAYAKILGVEVWRANSPRVTLGSFSFDNNPTTAGATNAPPPAGLGDMDGSILMLNIGTRAAERDIDNKLDGAENFEIDLSGGLVVSAFGVNQTFTGVGLISANGGANNDSIVIAEALPIAAYLNGGAGDDTFATGASNDTLLGDSGRDHLDGGAGDDSINGGSEDDILIGGAGADSIDGGDGRDIVSYFSSANGVSINLETGVNTGGDAQGDHLYNIEIVEGSAQADTIIGSAAADTFVGIGGNDTLNGGAGNDVLAGNAGNDTLDGGLGDDTMIGGLGDDTYYADSLSDAVRENALNEISNPALGGNDTIIAAISYSLDHVDRQDIENLTIVGAATVGTGNALANIVTGNDSDNVLSGLDGNDTLNGGQGDDTLDGGAESDILIGGTGGDYLDGGAGIDTMSGGADGDIYIVDNSGDRLVETTGQGLDSLIALVDYTLAGGVSIEQIISGGTGLSLTGNEFDQTLTGDSGDNILQGADGADRLVGGQGTDTASYRDAGSRVTIDLGLSVQQGGDAEGDTYVSIEIVEGSGFGDSLTGNSGGNILKGLGGTDTILGLGGSDILYGGQGADLIDGGIDSDTMIGGAGDDTYHVDSYDDVVDEESDNGSGYDHIITGLDYSIANNNGIERLTITGTARNATGNDNNNLITTTSGNDTINGGFGADQMIGGDGDDLYYIDNLGDVADEQANEGHDTIRLASALISPTQGTPDPVVNYTLATWGANVEDLIVTDSVRRINITGNDLDNLIVGNGRENTIHGGLGNDEIHSGGGSDELYGDAGNDSGHFALSNPTYYSEFFDGGGDIDTLVMDWSIATNNISYSSSYYHVGISDRGDGSYYGNHFLYYTNVERFNLTGGAGNDDLRGGSLGDTLIGGAGNDWLYGGTGRDNFDGGSGVDMVLTTVASAIGKDFVLRLGDAQGQELVVNEGTNIETYWKDIEAIRITTGAGDDLVDVRGIPDDTNIAQMGEGHYFDAGEGDDTFAVDLNSRSYAHTFIAGAGIDTLIMDWSKATGSISYSSSYYHTGLSDIGNGNYTGNHFLSYSGVERFILTGGAGNDDLRGGALDDILKGGAGNDWLYGGTGKGTYFGGDGVDMVFATIASASGKDFVLRLGDAQGATVTVNEGTDIETKWRDVEALRITTGSGNDFVDVRGIPDDTNIAQLGEGHYFDAGDGDDTFAVDLNSRSYAHTYIAGAGTDTLIMDWSKATGSISYSSSYYHTGLSNIGNGNYTGNHYLSYSGVERFILTGGAGNDDLRGGALDDLLKGGAGNDWLYGGTGKGTYNGGDGVDMVFATIASASGKDFVLRLGDAQGATVTVNEGTDIETKWRDVEALRITTGSGNDFVDVRGIPDDTNIAQMGEGHYFDAGEGDDTFAVDLNSRSYAHTYIAGAGTDTLIMDWSKATGNISYSSSYYHTGLSDIGNGNYAGNHFLNYSGVERFILTGGAGNDDLRGGALDDILKGGAGNDWLYGGAGKGTYDGGAGVDIVLATIASAVGKDFVLRLADARSATVTVNEGTDIETKWRDIEALRITTGAGNDIVDVRGIPEDTNLGLDGSAHYFDAGAGDDTFAVDLNSRSYEHNFVGGEGTDTLIMDWSKATNGISYSSSYYHTVLNNLGNGNYYGNHFQRYSGVERFQLTGGAGGDDLRGGALDDILKGGAGNDWLHGGAGKGTYDGGAGIDIVLATIASTSGKDFVLRLGDAQDHEVVVNEGTDIETRWKDVEAIRITTGAGDDLVDVRGIPDDTNLGLDGSGHYFDAGAGDDTFAVDLNSRSYEHNFVAGEGTDTLIMDWSKATNGISYSSSYYHTVLDNLGSGNYNGNHFQRYSGVERFQLTGGAGGDDLRGGALDDVLVGGGGNDKLVGNGGSDSFSGGAGTDFVSTTIASSAGTNFRLKLADAQMGTVSLKAGSGIGTSWNSIEVVDLTTGAGNDLVDLRGIGTVNAGIFGGNNFNAGDGDDVFAIDIGSRAYSHSFAGGEGSDILILDWSDAQNAISSNGYYFYTSLSDRGDGSYYGNHYMYHSGVERFQLYGGSANDSLAAGSGNDLLNGGLGNDALTGGAGSDRFVYSAGNDVITDFAISEDVIQSSLFSSFGSFEEVLDLVNKSNETDTVITFSEGNTLTLQGISWRDLEEAIIANEAPTFTSFNGAATGNVAIAENGRSVMTMAAIDSDSTAPLRYSIAGGANASLFAINAVTGALSFINAPNFEAPAASGGDNIYDVDIRVRDNFGKTSTQSLAVTIQNVNEAPTITSSGGNAAASIRLAENTAAVVKVAANDVDQGDHVAYSIAGGSNAALFKINQTTGALTFKSAPDFENPGPSGGDNVYNLIVAATDDFGRKDTQTIAITITNVAGITFNGGTKADVRTGTGEEDILRGNGNNDRLDGALGNDRLEGGAGNDTLTGGGGDDIFVFNSALNVTTNVDRIIDFRVADDVIHLDDAFFTKIGKRGDLADGAFEANRSGLANDKFDRIIYETDTGNLYYDADGNGKNASGILFATMQKNLGLSADDFVLV